MFLSLSLFRFLFLFSFPSIYSPLLPQPYLLPCTRPLSSLLILFCVLFSCTPSFFLVSLVSSLIPLPLSPPLSLPFPRFRRFSRCAPRRERQSAGARPSMTKPALGNRMVNACRLAAAVLLMIAASCSPPYQSHVLRRRLYRWLSSCEMRTFLTMPNCFFLSGKLYKCWLANGLLFIVYVDYTFSGLACLNTALLKSLSWTSLCCLCPKITRASLRQNNSRGYCLVP